MTTGRSSAVVLVAEHVVGVGGLDVVVVGVVTAPGWGKDHADVDDNGPPVAVVEDRSAGGPC
jgi:hypothetical protein